jgi:hypothetical protein
VVLGVQKEPLKRLECLVVKCNAQAETKGYGSEEEVGDVGESVEGVEEVETHIVGDSDDTQKEAIEGCRGSLG